MSRVSLSRRLKRLREAIIPRDSVTARVEQLPEKERQYFDRWKSHIDWMIDWCNRQSINPYQHMIENQSDWPRLLPSIERMLFREEPYQ